MAQHDYVIANGTGAAVRSDLNNALAAIVSQNSGATAPATTYAFQFWADTTTGLLKLRNSANSAWVTLFQLDGEWSTLPVENGTAAAPSIYFKDSGTDTGFYSPGTDQVGISTAGTSRLTIDANGNLAVDTNTLYVDAPNNRVGIGTSSVNGLLHIGIADSRAILLNNSSIGTAAGDGTYISNKTDGTFAIINQENASFTLGTSNTDRITITGGGLVGIGNTSPGSLNSTGNQLVVGSGTGNQGLTIFAGSSSDSNIYFADGTAGTAPNIGYIQYRHASDRFDFGTVDTTRMSIDSSGRLLVGFSSAFDSAAVGTDYSIGIERANYVGFALKSNIANATPSYLVFNKSRGTTLNSKTVVASGDALGSIVFAGADGTNMVAAGGIDCYVDGTPGSNDMPGRLVFSTTADGASSPTERMRITNNGEILIGTTTHNPGLGNTTSGIHFGGSAGFGIFSRSSGIPLYAARNTDDGTLIEFRQDGTIEGSISVSGTTVTLNGAHLSRWSQIPGIDPHDKTVRPEILRGTVMSNLDEMCDWIDPNSGVTQANEQLNKTKISNIEGDKNVAGVFQSWDDDDDTWVNDYYLAMTGDFVIRIKADVTVERGDLLMSAGDGTAKPQADDAVRSCTVAKVTSTHVSHTHPDGSYCVPCVLMAC